MVSVNERKLQEGGTLLTVDPSSDVLIWKAVGSAGEQMHFPRCLKSPFEKERGKILQRSSFGVEGHVPRKRA
jgi:hypothetical protein